MNNRPWLIVIGASGCGKTAAIDALEARDRPWLRCHHFDSLGVPSVESMERDYGGQEAWQEHATLRWIERLAASERAYTQILEGQTRPSFIQPALSAIGHSAKIVLLECSPEVRRRRLTQRGSAELASARMDVWAKYLRNEAERLGLAVIDTNDKSVGDVADILELLATSSEDALRPDRN